MKKRRTFTPEFKAKVVLSVLSGEKTANQICREQRISQTVFGRWKKQFLERAPQLFASGGPDEQAKDRITELE